MHWLQLSLDFDLTADRLLIIRHKVNKVLRPFDNNNINNNRISTVVKWSQRGRIAVDWESNDSRNGVES